MHPEISYFKYLLSLVLVLVGIVAEVTVLLVLHRKKWLRLNLWFTILICFYVVRSSIALLAFFRLHLGGIFTPLPLVLETLDCLLQFAVLADLCWLFFRRAWNTTSRHALWILVGGGAFLLALWVTFRLGNWPMQPSYPVLLDNAGILLAACFAELLILGWNKEISPDPQMTSSAAPRWKQAKFILRGFGLYSLAALICIFITTLLPRGSNGIILLQYVRVGAYLAAAFYWGIQFSKMEDENSPAAPGPEVYSKPLASKSS